MTFRPHSQKQLEVLARKIHELYLLVSQCQSTIKTKEQNMPNDPLAELAAIKSGYEALVAKVNALLAAAANQTDTVSPDVQTALDALATEVAAQGVAAPTPAPSTPPAGS